MNAPETQSAAPSPIAPAELVPAPASAVFKLAPGEEPAPCPFPCSICRMKGRQS